MLFFTALAAVEALVFPRASIGERVFWTAAADRVMSAAATDAVAELSVRPEFAPDRMTRPVNVLPVCIRLKLIINGQRIMRSLSMIWSLQSIINARIKDD